MTPARLPASRGGFALAFVVFVLFVIGILGSAGYAVVALEADLSTQAEDRMEASAIARAGLARYLGEHLGIPDDTTTYAIGTGETQVSARFIATVDAAQSLDLYLITSDARVVDPRWPDSPTRATVRQYAHLHRRPISRLGALQASYSSVRLNYNGYVSGYDWSSAGCAEAGEDVYGVAHRGTLTVGGWGSYVPTVEGSPSANASFGSHAAVFDSTGIRWDVLTDPNFPVEYEGEVPETWTLEPDEYPVVRMPENSTLDSSDSGRGVLIAPGRVSFGSSFQWDGIVLAGEVADMSWRYLYVRGMLIVGLDGVDNAFQWNGMPYIYYDVCAAISATESLAFWEALEGSWTEDG